MKLEECYAILGLEANASEAQVKGAYKKLALQKHPDKNPNDRDRANAEFLKISEAYKRITDPDSFKDDDEEFEMDESAMNAIFAEVIEEFFGGPLSDMMDEMSFLGEDDQIPIEEMMAVMEDMTEMMSPDMSGCKNYSSDDREWGDHCPISIDEMVNLMDSLCARDTSKRSKFKKRGDNKSTKGRLGIGRKNIDVKRSIKTKKPDSGSNQKKAQERNQEFIDDSWESMSDSSYESNEDDLYENVKNAVFEGVVQDTTIDPIVRISNSKFPTSDRHVVDNDDEHDEDDYIDYYNGFGKNCVGSGSRRKYKSEEKSFTSAPSEATKSEITTLAVDDIVNYKSKEGKIVFIGEVHYAKGLMVGVIMNDPVGKNDGFVKGRRYFECPPGHGLMMRASELTRISS